MAFGQTGSGKTHTMQGPPEDRGVNVRALAELFEQIAQRRAEAGVEDELAVSILEIYNDSIQDLLAAGPRRGLEIKQASQGWMHVPDLAIVPVSSLEQVLALLEQGEEPGHGRHQPERAQLPQPPGAQRLRPESARRF